VVVDKPAFLGVEDTRRLLDAAAARGLCIAEAAAYLWHPQFDEVRKIFAGAGTAPTRIVAVFSCPPLPPDNFRCRRMSGGGALWDQGVYAVSPGRALFGEEPSEITCRVTADNGEVDMSFSVLAVYPGGRSMAGHFGFNTGYRNTLDVLGPKVSVSLDRVFSLMPDAESEIRATVEERPVSRTCPAADSFALMLRDVMDAIESGGGGRFAEAMLADAVAVDRMRRSAGVA
jgi:predicted dehydrogenase